MVNRWKGAKLSEDPDATVVCSYIQYLVCLHASLTILWPTNSSIDKAVRKLFRQWKEPIEKATTSTKMAHVLAPIRPTWPWEQSKNDDKSPGRNVQHTSEPAFLEPAQQYRILCRSKNTPNEFSLAGRPELMLLAGLMIVVVCMTLFDMVVVAWRG